MDDEPIGALARALGGSPAIVPVGTKGVVWSRPYADRTYGTVFLVAFDNDAFIYCNMTMVEVVL